MKAAEIVLLTQRSTGSYATQNSGMQHTVISNRSMQNLRLTDGRSAHSCGCLVLLC
jgi:hypothetical protein